MRPKYRLISCLWELTLKCSLNCMHCGSVGGSARRKELSLAECYPVAEELSDLGCEEVTFIGGEIFLFRGWEQLGHYLSDRGMMVNIMSNGFHIGEPRIQQILTAGLTNVGLSIDGLEPTHNFIRRNPESFKRLKQAMDLLNRHGIEIGVVTSLMETNYPDLAGLYHYLVANRVKLWQIQLVNPMGNMAGQRDLILRPERIPKLTAFIHEKNLDGRMLVVAGDNIGYYDEHESFIRGRRSPFSYWEGCQAGITSVFIDSVGNIKGCGAMYDEAFIEGNVRYHSLKKIWNHPDSFAYNRKFREDQLTGYCRTCDAWDACLGGCRASNYFVTGSEHTNAYCASQLIVSSKLKTQNSKLKTQNFLTPDS